MFLLQISSILECDTVSLTFQGNIYFGNVGVSPPTKWCHVTEDLHLQQHHCENLSSHVFAFLLPQIIK